MSTPIHGSNKVSVSRKNIDPQRGVPAINGIVSVFLIRQTVDAKNWFAEIWDEAENPWLTGDIPKAGEIVKGTIVRGAGADRVVVELDEPPRPTAVEAVLLRSDAPDGSALDIGDRIAAVVARVSEDELAIELDCRAAMKRLRKDAEHSNLIFDLFDRRANALAKPPAPAPQRLKDETLIIFDNNENLIRVLTVWAQRYGAECEGTSDPARLREILDDARDPFILVDYAGVDYEQAISCAQQSGVPRARIAMWSGDSRAKKEADRLQIGFEPKPTTLQRLTDLVQGRALTPTGLSADDGSESALWAGRRTTGKVTHDAEEYFEKLGRRLKLVGALWLRREQELVYSIQARSGGIDVSGAVGADFWRSAVTRSVPPMEDHDTQDSAAADADTAAANAKPDIGALPALDPILKLFPDALRGRLNFVAFQLTEPGAKLRLVVFFNDGPFDQGVIDALTHEHDHLHHLLQLFRVTEHLDAIEDFAKVGRLYAASLHEIRNGLSAIIFHPQWIIDDLESGEKDKASKAALELRDALQSLHELANAELDQVRKFRLERVDINRMVARLIERMNTYQQLKHPRWRAKIVPILDPGLDSQELLLSPIIVEQPLVNLIDNALYHVGDHAWGRIEVETKLTGEPATPVHIYVRDNGRGVSAAGAATLFEPRESTKSGVAGTGMGLYASRNIVRAAGGELECTERLLWLGATFRMRLPIGLGEAKLAEQKP